MGMTQDAIDALECRNAEWQKSRRRFGPFTWGHLVDGFYGFHCPEIERPRALTEDDLIRFGS
eukprot:13457707-Alexandrium_andersonii.AAC.1